MSSTQTPAKIAITCSSGNDGVGAQFHRKLAAFALARHLKIPHYFQPFDVIEQQGLNVLTKNEKDPLAVAKANERLKLPSDITAEEITADNYERIRVTSREQFSALIQTQSKPILLDLDLPNRNICDHIPDIQKYCENSTPKQIPKNTEFTIGIHVRRGELFVVDSWRMLPNSWQIEQTRRVLERIRLQTGNTITPRIELYTEVPKTRTEITGKHPGILERINEPVTITPEQCSITDFDVLPNLHKFLNEDPQDTLERMTNADILITSRSSFSACAAHMKTRGVSIYKPAWYAYRPREIPDNDANFNHRLDQVLDTFFPPRIFHQIWLSNPQKNRPRLPSFVAEDFLRHNAKWKQGVCDEERGVKFLRQQYGEGVVQKWRATRKIQHRSDFLRCAILQAMGGVYADVDQRIHFPLEPLLEKQGDCDFIGTLGVKGDCEMAIGFMGTTAKNPILHQFLDTILKAPEDIQQAYFIRTFYELLKKRFGVNRLEPFTKYKYTHAGSVFQCVFLQEYMISPGKYHIRDEDPRVFDCPGNGQDYPWSRITAPKSPSGSILRLE